TPSRVTTTSASVKDCAAHGTWKLICSTPFTFTAARMGAAKPPTVIEMPSRLNGKGIVVLAPIPGAWKFEPNTVPSEPATIPDRKLAALVTPAGIKVGPQP